jgi:hypothetical protein|tara:strand:+ start:90 stop:263 length:174 start_codon:yes stop_codon:yes gene_type:complete
MKYSYDELLSWLESNKDKEAKGVLALIDALQEEIYATDDFYCEALEPFNHTNMKTKQ